MVSVSERVGTIICFQVRQSGQSRGGTKSDLERAGSRSRAARRASLSLPSLRRAEPQTTSNGNGQDKACHWQQQ